MAFTEPSQVVGVQTSRRNLPNGDSEILGQITSVQLPNGNIVPAIPGSTFRIVFRESSQQFSPVMRQYDGVLELGGPGQTNLTAQVVGMSAGTSASRRVSGAATYGGPGVQEFTGSISFPVLGSQSVNFEILA